MNSVLIDPHGDELKCPRCGEVNLHQGTVEVFNREREGGPATAILIPSGELAAKAGDPSRNPSDRRQGIAIDFSCEFCSDEHADEPFTLVIYQHKGTTYVRWEDPIE